MWFVPSANKILPLKRRIKKEEIKIKRKDKRYLRGAVQFSPGSAWLGKR
jgi:hypothetical protein